MVCSCVSPTFLILALSTFDIKFGYILRNTDIVYYETRLIPTLRCNNGMVPIVPRHPLYDWCKLMSLYTCRQWVSTDDTSEGSSVQAEGRDSRAGVSVRARGLRETLYRQVVPWERRVLQIRAEVRPSADLLQGGRHQGWRECPYELSTLYAVNFQLINLS